MHSDIILIGPVGTGKSTLGKLLAEKLLLPQVSIDKVRFEYYKEIGYDEAYAKQLRETAGFLALYRYWKPFTVNFSLSRVTVRISPNNPPQPGELPAHATLRY